MINRKLTDIERTAYHESGHAVIDVLLGVDFNTVSIVKKIGSLGRVEPVGVTKPEMDEIVYADPFYHEKNILSLYAGCVAVQIELNDRSDWNGFGIPGNDRESDADQLADHLVAIGACENDWEKFIKITDEILRQNWPSVDRVARNLLRKQTLTFSDVKKLVGKFDTPKIEDLLSD